MIHKKYLSRKSSDPVLHVMDSLKDYHTELVQKEVDSLSELNNIRGSLEIFLEKQRIFRENYKILIRIFIVSNKPPGNLQQSRRRLTNRSDVRRMKSRN